MSKFPDFLSKFITPSQSKIVIIHDHVVINLLTWLRLGSSHLREHKFKGYFEDNLNTLHSSSIENETAVHFFQCYNFYNVVRKGKILKMTYWSLIAPFPQNMMKSYVPVILIVIDYIYNITSCTFSLLDQQIVGRKLFNIILIFCFIFQLHFTLILSGWT